MPNRLAGERAPGNSGIDARLRHGDGAMIQFARTGSKDLCFRTCPRRGAVKLPVTQPCLARPARKRKGDRTQSARRFGPLRRAALAWRPDHQVGHIHSSRCRTTSPPEGERRSALQAERCASRLCRWRILRMRTGPVSCRDEARSVPPPRPSPHGAMVEQDGIEPTTSCLQSTRSTD